MIEVTLSSTPHSTAEATGSVRLRDLSLFCAAALLATSLLLPGPASAASKARAAARKPAAKAPARKASAKRAAVKATPRTAKTAKAAAAQDKAPTAKLAAYTEKLAGTLAKIDMVPVPGGTYSFADPAKGGQKQQVTIKPLWVSKTEVTWDIFDPYAFPQDAAAEQAGKDAESRPSKPYGAPDRGFGHQGFAAISVAIFSAESYCKWLSEKTGKKYRLPTEAEWEYICTAGGKSAAPSAQAVPDYAWVAENSGDKTHPVAQKKPNAWGLYDMLGNAGEWCIASDGKPVLRGGTYKDSADKVNCQTRAPYTIDWQMQDPQFPKSRWWYSDGPFVGFRIVREL